MTLQGGGDSYQKFSSAPFQLSMKVVSSAEVMQTVEIDILAEILSERQIIQAISILYKEKERNPQILGIRKVSFRDIVL